MAVAKRLRAIRWLYGGGDSSTQQAFATKIGVEYKNWNNWENGYPFPRDAALALVKRFPSLSLDWIWLGKTNGMTVAMVAELELAMAKSSAPTTAKRASTR